MKIGVMQPYFLPYIGYFQLIAAVDIFVLYDNIKYTKKGWINRNRLLRNNNDVLFTLPLEKDSDSLHIVDRFISKDFDRDKLLSQFRGAYHASPNFSIIYPLLERIMYYSENNLFKYIHNSIIEICAYLKLNTTILISSSLEIDHDLKSEAKVIAICQELGASIYINNIGGASLYNKNEFLQQGVRLQFIESEYFSYDQFEPPFIPWLSIIDVLMFNPVDVVLELIHSQYRLI